MGGWERRRPGNEPPSPALNDEEGPKGEPGRAGGGPTFSGSDGAVREHDVADAEEAGDVGADAQVAARVELVRGALDLVEDARGRLGDAAVELLEARERRALELVPREVAAARERRLVRRERGAALLEDLDGLGRARRLRALNDAGVIEVPRVLVFGRLASLPLRLLPARAMASRNRSSWQHKRASNSSRFELLHVAVS